jgi:hypothetical protein
MTMGDPGLLAAADKPGGLVDAGDAEAAAATDLVACAWRPDAGADRPRIRLPIPESNECVAMRNGQSSLIQNDFRPLMHVGSHRMQ